MMGQIVSLLTSGKIIECMSVLSQLSWFVKGGEIVGRYQCYLSIWLLAWGSIIAEFISYLSTYLLASAW